MTKVVFSPVESKWEGYYRIPGHSKNCISEEGKLIDAETGKEFPTHRSTGYVYASIYHDANDEVSSIGVHRLMALAFLGEPENPKAIPNHLDGIRDNNIRGNLEWSDYSGNIDHAYRNGLRTDNRPVLAKDLRDESVLEFHALAECARHFDVSTERIWRNIRDNTGNIYFGYYVFRFKDDKRPWPDLDADDIGKVNNGTPKDVLGYEIATDKIYVAESINQLACAINVKRATIGYALRTGRQYPVQGYLFKLKDDPTPWKIPATTPPVKDCVAES